MGSNSGFKGLTQSGYGIKTSRNLLRQYCTCLKEHLWRNGKRLDKLSGNKWCRNFMHLSGQNRYWKKELNRNCSTVKQEFINSVPVKISFKQFTTGRKFLLHFLNFFL